MMRKKLKKENEQRPIESPNIISSNERAEPFTEARYLLPMAVLMVRASRFSKVNRYMKDGLKMDFVVAMAGPFPAKVKFIKVNSKMIP